MTAHPGELGGEGVLPSSRIKRKCKGLEMKAERKCRKRASVAGDRGHGEGGWVKLPSGSKARAVTQNYLRNSWAVCFAQGGKHTATAEEMQFMGLESRLEDLV